jgi:LEA14-like dessication related protein
VSCSLFRQLSFEEPSVRLTRLEITDIDLSGVSVNLWLEVFNPNGYDIRTTWIEAELDIEGTDFGQATHAESVILIAADNTIVTIPADFTWEGIGVGARALLQRGSVNYDLKTRLKVKTSLGNHTVTIGNRGEVDVWN